MIGRILGWFVGSTGAYIAGGLLLAGVLAWGTQTWRLHTAQTDLSTERAASATREADLQRRATEAEAHERSIEQRTAERLQGITDETTKKLAAADAAASAANASALSLRDRVAALASAGRRACGRPAASAAGSSAPDPLGMLADVLGRADARAGLLAAEADRRRERALACEAAYEVVRDRQAQKVQP